MGRWIALLVALAALFVVPDAEAQRGADAGQRDARLERWRGMDPERRAELRRRFEDLQALAPEERARLVERAQKLQVEMQRTLESLGQRERALIEAMPAEERARVLRALVADQARVATARLRSRMTPEERARLAEADAEERVEILREVRARELDRIPEALQRLGADLGLDERELQRLRGGTREESRAALLELVRRRAGRHAERHGPPRGRSPEQWQRTLELPDDAFVRAYGRIRRTDPAFGIPEGRREAFQRGRERLARDLEFLGLPTAEQRAEDPRAREILLRRKAVLEARPRIEALMVERLRLPVEVAARVRTLDDDGFVRFWRFTIRALREGAEPAPALERWFTRSRRGPVDSPGEGARPNRWRERGGR